jgi:hypothetical protein
MSLFVILDIRKMSAQYIKFPKTYSGATPADVYKAVCSINPAYDKKNEVFFNMPITSSGARRLIPATETPTRDRIIEIAIHNIAIAKCLISAAEPYLPEQTVIGVSADFGLWDGWGETEYMRYWFYHVSGISIEGAQKFEDDLAKREHIDHATMNDYGKRHEDREIFYEDTLRVFCQYLQNEKPEIRPIGRMIALPDSIASLGCRNEMRLAQFLNISLEVMKLDPTHKDYQGLACRTVWDQIQQIDKSFEIPHASEDGIALMHFSTLTEQELKPITV